VLHNSSAETAVTRPVGLHFFRRAFHTALAEAGINVQIAMALAALIELRARNVDVQHLPKVPVRSKREGIFAASWDQPICTREVDLPAITPRAEMDHSPIRVANTLNLPKIVHPRRTRPPGTGPQRTSRATIASSYASTPRRPRARRSTSGPFLLMAILLIVAIPPSGGQLPDRAGLHRITRILAPGYSVGQREVAIDRLWPDQRDAMSAAAMRVASCLRQGAEWPSV
jgi:hypothetical protein